MTDDTDSNNIVLRAAGLNPQQPFDSNDNRTWDCRWDNPTGLVKTIHATAICLVPAE
jgi:hypothetical protein